MEAVVFFAQSQREVPLKTGLFPVLIPLLLGTRLDKELHLHLFELTHTEDKLACYDLVAEGLSCLGNPKRNFHTACFLYIGEIDKDTLSCFRT